MPLELVRTPVTAERTGPRIALFALKLAPEADARRPGGSSTRRDRRQNTAPKIDRESLRHACRPPSD